MLLAGVGVLACDAGEPAPPSSEAEGLPALAHVGAAVCAECHAREWEAWRGSHHDHAMEAASAETVLGDFADRELVHGGDRSRFFTRDGKFFVETTGPDGARGVFEVEYTFGVAPLQQYLVRLADGRLQPLATAWDTRSEPAGGQRWFHLYADEVIPHDDAIHWTSRAQGWNSNCASCHSTGLRKGYDAARDRYATKWDEIDVACEACHGSGSRHVAWAAAGAEGDDAHLVADFASEAEGVWAFAEGNPIAKRSAPRTKQTELDTCAPCHARRTPLVASPSPGRAFLDGYRPALLDEGLYFADGQIQDEVYVWGSFLQSRMHAAGVVCSDCHDPHSLAVAEPPDATCGRCHQPEAFATPAHHHHAADSEGASCVGCHMPSRTYMGVDERRDHGFRVPRPAVSQRIGAPDACTACHSDRDSGWAAEQAQAWWGAAYAETPHWGEALHAGRIRAPGAIDALAAVAADASTPGIVRATALRLLQGSPPEVAGPAIERGMRDPDGVVRMAAAGAAQALPAEEGAQLLAPLWRDPLRAVRIESAVSTRPEALERIPPNAAAAYGRALQEHERAQRVMADTPAGRVNLGLLNAERGALAEARRQYEASMSLAPWFVPAYVNLADLLRLDGRDEEARDLLLEAQARVPDDPDVHHALGLTQVRLGERDAALRSLAAAMRGAPRNPRYAYVYGLGLHGEGHGAEALRALRAALVLHPGDPDLLLGLAMISRDLGDRDAARRYAESLIARSPGNELAQRLLAELGSNAP